MITRQVGFPDQLSLTLDGIAGVSQKIPEFPHAYPSMSGMSHKGDHIIHTVRAIIT